MTTLTHLPTSRYKAVLIGEFALALSRAKTVKDCRYLAMLAFRRLLDIVYPEQPNPSPVIALTPTQE